MTVAQLKLAAIRARLSGQWGHPALLILQPVTDNAESDIWQILHAECTHRDATYVQALIDAAE